MRYVKGQQLFREGSEAEGIFVVNKGVVKVQVKGFKEKPFILFLAGAGDMIGYQVNSARKNMVSAIAVEETYVCFIERKDFETVLQKNVLVRDDLTAEFNNELHKKNLRIVSLAQMTVREKVASAFLMIAKAYKRNRSGELFEINLSRQDIGDLIGVNKEQVSKSLADLKKDKVVATSGKQLKFLNYKQLEDMVGTQFI